MPACDENVRFAPKNGARGWHYLVHGLRLHSTFRLPEMVEWAERDHDAQAWCPDLVLEGARPGALPQPRVRDWTVRRPGALSVAHGPWGTLLEAYCGSRAWIPPRGAAEPLLLRIGRAPGVSTDQFHHTVLHAFVPLGLALRGITMVHAACVVHGGQAYLFAGDSKLGKSTLAAGFAGRGLTVFSDDVVRVQIDRDGLARAWPGYPGARLRANSFLFGPSNRQVTRTTGGLPRFRVHVDRIGGSLLEGTPVAGVYFLGRCRSALPQFARLSPLLALTPWVKSGFLLAVPPADRSREALSRFAPFTKAIPAWELSYRRSSVHFESLLTAVLQHMEERACAEKHFRN